MAHIELDLMERQQLEKMLLAKAPVAMIAEKLSQHRSTTYREINRNTFADEEMPELNGYYGKIAQQNAAIDAANLSVVPIFSPPSSKDSRRDGRRNRSRGGCA